MMEQLGPEHCTLVWEQGNHFNDNEGRLARAFARCMENGINTITGHDAQTGES